MKFKSLSKIALLALGATAVTGAAAHAGTSGSEFQEAYEMMTGWVEGYLGRGIAIAFLIVGLFLGIARQNLLACGVAILAAFGLIVTPTVLDNVLTATVSQDTVQIVAEAPAATAAPVAFAE